MENWVNAQTLKSFIIDLVTSTVTLVLTWLSLEDNLLGLGINPAVAPVVGLVFMAILTAWRRFKIEKTRE